MSLVCLSACGIIARERIERMFLDSFHKNLSVILSRILSI